MSFLFPLYLAGAAAIGLPILFHLIRRQPKGNVPFSSLMFLRPTPPRLTRRSRLDNWPLLLCRALALLFLAAAFTRPFFRSVSSTEIDSERQPVIVAIDTSASMTRPGMWRDAMNLFGEVVDDLNQGDEIAVLTFDHQPKMRFSFEQSRASSPSERDALLRSSLDEVVPRRVPTDFAEALIFCAEMASSYEGNQVSDAVDQPVRVVLISDMQSGGDWESLHSFDWPESLRLDVRQLDSGAWSNAWANVLESSGLDDEDAADFSSDDGEKQVRVRVSNSQDSQQSRFELAWLSENGSVVESRSTNVVGGESQVVRLKAPTESVNRLRVSGDDVEFDNLRYLVVQDAKEYELLVVGSEPQQQDARESLAYYLERIPFGNRSRTVALTYLESVDEDLPVEKSPLVVVTRPCDAGEIDRLKQFADSGGTVFLVVAEDQPAWKGTLSSAFESPSLALDAADVEDYSMLSEIKFRHPLFGALSDPQFNDFSKIRFWKHRRITGLDDKVDVVAAFDTGDPAVMQRSFGDGKILVMAAGWQPSESQLALSTKFIPLMLNVFELSLPGEKVQQKYFAGDKIPAELATSLRLMQGDDETADPDVESGEDVAGLAKSFGRPGIYECDGPNGDLTFAVNLPESESHLEPIDVSELERLGVLLEDGTTREAKLADARQQRDIELEDNQKLWQWCLVAALALIAGETLLVRMAN
ncbi:BatA domain-containing protein [Rhodopirellula sallentina]|uniref:Inter-alpha-trypsin inhibitor heavy chain H2-like protein n=1 Tax=Rhodopirellula sallentina SM41 TaxID=1263870 RepID=M5U522_9BACT|nr:BatA domain-containing protein [Rhodopirellula sallentina]EMI56364.1 inter-alpha-trypsin inhibitor heavy chain H2 precursor-like protein [Rhodopirellula sallentina SM41]